MLQDRPYCFASTQVTFKKSETDRHINGALLAAGICKYHNNSLLLTVYGVVVNGAEEEDTL